MRIAYWALSVAGLVAAQAKGGNGNIQTTGKFGATHSTDPGLSRHTIFMPQNAPADAKLPVLIWGNGACSGNGLLFQKSLLNVASHGYFVIAMGSPNGKGQTSGMNANSSPLQVEALNFVSKNAGKGKYTNVLPNRIAVAGQSCGGLESSVKPYIGRKEATSTNLMVRYRVWNDQRVNAIGIFNSGEFSVNNAKKVNKPIFYFLGGPSDIAYQNGERDFANLPASTPSWKGNMPLGHMADWSVTTGKGKFNNAEIKWLDWILKGDNTAKAWFTGGGAKSDGWNVQAKNLERINIAPL